MTLEERASEIGIRCRDTHHRRRVDQPWACQACVAEAIRAEREVCAKLIEGFAWPDAHDFASHAAAAIRAQV